MGRGRDGGAGGKKFKRKGDEHYPDQIIGNADDHEDADRQKVRGMVKRGIKI